MPGRVIAALELVLFHRLADADSAAIRRVIVGHGLKPRDAIRLALGAIIAAGAKAQR
jgi:hypothetical protein